MEHTHETKPWRPTIEREPEFNAFVNPTDRELENPLPLEEPESETEDTIEAERVAAEAKHVHAPQIPIDAGQREQLIAQIAYAIAERRGFCPGCELDDWLIAEAEVDRGLSRG